VGLRTRSKLVIDGGDVEYTSDGSDANEDETELDPASRHNGAPGWIDLPGSLQPEVSSDELTDVENDEDCAESLVIVYAENAEDEYETTDDSEWQHLIGEVSIRHP